MVYFDWIERAVKAADREVEKLEAALRDEAGNRSEESGESR
jgi:hypothetical protein